MQSRLARALPALALVVAALGASCSSSSNSTSPTPPVTGPTFSFAFPTAGSPPPGNPGTSNQRTFTAAEVGSWSYHCIPHAGSGMVGTIVVDAAAPTDSAFVAVGFNGSGQDLKFFPSTVTIQPGGHVRWANWNSMTIHTASR